MPQMHFIFKDDTVKKLKVLSHAYGTTYTAFIALKIDQEYDALNGSPKTKQMLKAMQECAEILRQATAPVITDPVQTMLDGRFFGEPSNEKEPVSK